MKPSKCPKTSKLSIGQIIGVSYDHVLKEMREGNDWVSPELNQLQKDGKIIFVPMGATLQQPFIDAGGNLSEKKYEVQQITIPCVWSQKDELKTKTEKKKCELAYALMKNGLYSHDDLILAKWGQPPYGPGSDKKLAVSKNFHYVKGETWKVSDSHSWVFQIFTAYALVD